MNFSRTAAILGLALAGFVMGGTQANAQYNLTLCGASPGGLWSLLGAGIDAAVREAHPGSTVTYQTSGGGYANVVQLDQRRCDLAIIHDAEAIAAIKGEEPFRQPIASMKTLAALYTWAPMQFIVRKSYADEHGITRLDDIGAKELPIRILLNRRGNVSSPIGASLLTAVGASPEQIESWGGSVIYSASEEQVGLMRDRRADAMFNSLFLNHSSLRQLASAIDLVLLPIGEAAASAVAEEWGINVFTIPGSDNAWSSHDVLTVTLSAQLFVREDADDQLVADVTAALIDNADRLRSAYEAMAPLDAELMASSGAVPYHPAAAAVYKARGLQ